MGETRLLIRRLDYDPDSVASWERKQAGPVLRIMGLSQTDTDAVLKALAEKKQVVICRFPGSDSEDDRLPLLDAIPFSKTSAEIADEVVKEVRGYRNRLGAADPKDKSGIARLQSELASRMVEYWAPLLQAARSVETSETGQRFLVLG